MSRMEATRATLALLQLPEVLLDLIEALASLDCWSSPLFIRVCCLIYVQLANLTKTSKTEHQIREWTRLGSFLHAGVFLAQASAQSTGDGDHQH